MSQHATTMMTARVGVNEAGDVVQEIDFCGQITRRFFNAAAAQLDAAIRARLIELGWTPPREGGQDE